MNSGSTKNSIISFILILSFTLTPFLTIEILNTKKAEAQGLGGVAGYASGLAPMIAKLPQCQEFLGNQVKGLFNGIGSLFSSNKAVSTPSGGFPAADDTSVYFQDIRGGDSFNEAIKTANLETANQISIDASLNSIQVHDPNIAKDIRKVLDKTSKIEKSTASINANSNCIQSIGRLVIKMLLQKLIVSTVNWINSGFDGSPAYVQDFGKFFEDIAKNEILQFGLEIDDDERYPFGKEWLRSTATAFNNKFQDNARYSLNELIQETTPEYSAITFNEDFSRGGWNAWTALTQVPANNPLGFRVMADNEIQRRLAGTSQTRAENIRDALQAADGFLGDERCVDPAGLTRTQNDAILRDPAVKPINGWKPGMCNKWEYVTLGSLVAKAATDAVGYPNNALLNAEDLNDAVAALLDALLGQFFPWLMEKGFANLGTDGADGQLYFTDNGSGAYRSRTQKDFAPIHLSSSWLAANPEFDIRTDLTQALIDEQRTYSDKLILQNKELFSITDGKEYNLNTGGGGNGNGTYCDLRFLTQEQCDALSGFSGFGNNSTVSTSFWFADNWPTQNTGTSGGWSMANLYSGTWAVDGGSGLGGIGDATWTQTGSGTGRWASPTSSGIWTLTDIVPMPSSLTNGTWTPLGALDSTNPPPNPPSGSTNVTGTSNAYGLLPVIYQLDYCIPGPHPGWEEDSRRTLADVMDKIIPETEASLENREAKAIHGVAGALAPLAGAAIGAALAGTATAAGLAGVWLGAAAGPVGVLVGAAIGAIFNAIFGGTSGAEKVMQYYSAIIFGLTGVLPDSKTQKDSLAGAISSKNGAVHILNEILNRYAKIMKATYFSSPEILPAVAKEAAVNFNQARGYEQMIVNNENRIALFKTTINLLTEIKGKVDALNAKYKTLDGQFYSGNPGTEEAYENELKVQINEFGRVSASMVNGDDLASTDNLLKQIIDKKDYLYKNLLKGEYGCEASLEKSQIKFPGFGSLPGERQQYNWSNFDALSVKRMTYPFPILYEYESSSQYGPGFLSFVLFSSTHTDHDGKGGGGDRRGPERLYVADLFPHQGGQESRFRHLGTISDKMVQDGWQGSSCSVCNGVFENIIGVY